MIYSINITRRAQKELSKLPLNIQEKVITNIKKLSKDPFPNLCKKLSGRDAWRIRVGSYRVIYEVYKEELSIIIILIGHRKDIYKKSLFLSAFVFLSLYF